MSDYGYRNAGLRDPADPAYQVEPVKPRLWRSRDNKVIAGVVGGLAEKFSIDPTLARVLYVAFSIFSAGFPGTLVYILLWMITRPYPKD